MIRVTVLYPNQEDCKFDEKYYIEKHLPMVGQRLRDYGLVRAEMDKGLEGGLPGSPAPYVAIGHLYFSSLDDMHKGLGTHGREIMGDVRNFTNVRAQIHVSEVVSSQE